MIRRVLAIPKKRMDGARAFEAALYAKILRDRVCGSRPDDAIASALSGKAERASVVDLPFRRGRRSCRAAAQKALVSRRASCSADKVFAASEKPANAMAASRWTPSATAE